MQVSWDDRADPAPPKKRSRFWYYILGFFGLIAFLTWWSEDTPEQAAQRAADDVAWHQEAMALQMIGDAIVAKRAALSAEISGLHQSLDLHIGSVSPEEAEALARYTCDAHMPDDWRVRVFLADGKIGAECKFLRR